MTKVGVHTGFPWKSVSERISKIGLENLVKIDPVHAEVIGLQGDKMDKKN